MKQVPTYIAGLLTSVMLIHCESPETAQAQNIDTSESISSKELSSSQKEGNSSFDASRGPVAVRGELLNAGSLNGKYVNIYETEGRDFFLIDSARVENGKFTFKSESLAPGLFKIGMEADPSKLGDLILTPREPDVTFVYVSTSFRNGFSNTDSRENQGFKEYIALEKKHEAELKTIRSGSGPNKRERIYEAQARFKITQDALATEYEGTYLANFVKHLQSPYRFSKAQYWNDIDFTDGSLIHSSVFPDRIEDYMRVHASAEKSPSEPMIGFYNAVDRIANLIEEEGSDEVLEFVLYTISEGFYSSGMEDLSLYVVDNYFYGDACGDADISELFKMKAAGIRNLQVGNTPPDFNLKDAQGNTVSFGRISEESEYTLLLFWASFCHKCEREIPELKRVYTAYKDKGFDVVAVSVDSDRSAWLRGIKANQANWYDLSDMLGWRSQVARDYRVTSTPVMFLVNKNRELVSKPKSAAELSAFLKNTL